MPYSVRRYQKSLQQLRSRSLARQHSRVALHKIFSSVRPRPKPRDVYLGSAEHIGDTCAVGGTVWRTSATFARGKVGVPTVQQSQVVICVGIATQVATSPAVAHVRDGHVGHPTVRAQAVESLAPVLVGDGLAARAAASLFLTGHGGGPSVPVRQAASPVLERDHATPMP